MRRSTSMATADPVHVARGRSVMVVGADAGARGNLPAIVGLNSEMPGEIAEVVYTDALYGHAQRLAREAASLGLPARAMAVPARALPTLDRRPDLLMSHVDRPEALLEAQAAAQAHGAAFLSYLFIRPYTMLPLGYMTSLLPEDSASAEEARLFAETLAPMTMRRGSAKALERGAPEGGLRETAVRAMFRAHAEGALRKAAAGLPPDCDPLQLTDGEGTYPFVVLDADRWCSAEEIEQRVLHERRDLVIEPGSRLFVAECSLVSAEMRLHDARFNRSDRRLATRGRQTLTAADFDAPPPSVPRAPEAPSSDSGLGAGLAALAFFAILLSVSSRTAPIATTD